MEWEGIYMVVAYARAAVTMLMLFVMDVLLSLPLTRKPMQNALKKADLPLPGPNEKMCQIEAFKRLTLKNFLDLTKVAKQGEIAPNSDLIDLSGRKCNLFDFISEDCPLVIKDFKKIIKEFENKKVRFLVIYISEAHPIDGWSTFGSKHKIQQHRSSQERIHAAELLVNVEQIGCEVVVDSMTNAATLAYGSLFDRLYIIRNNVIEYQGGPGPEKYSLKEMKDALNSLLSD